MNPIKPYTLEEIAYCASQPGLKRGAPELGERAARRIRQIGTSRMLFGSDAVPGTPPSVVLTYFWKLPLTSEEFHAIAQNVPPYMRWRARIQPP